MRSHLFTYERLNLGLFAPRDRLGQGRPPSLFTYYVNSGLEIIDPAVITDGIPACSLPIYVWILSTHGILV